MTRSTRPTRLRISDEALKAAYSEHKTMVATAEALEISTETVKRRLKALGVDTSRKVYGQNALTAVSNQELLETLKRTENIGETATILGIDRRTVERRLKAMGIKPKSARRADSVTSRREKIKRALRDLGPMDLDDLATELNESRDLIYDTIRYARRRAGSKHFRIYSYQRRIGERGKPIVTYAIGPGKDAKKPVIDLRESSRESHKRWRDKNRAELRATRRKTPVDHPWHQLMRA